MEDEMKTNISGYMFSYAHPSGQERLAVHTFGVSRTKAKLRLKSFNHRQLDNKIEPLSMYSVNIVVNGIAPPGEAQGPKQ